MNRDYDNYHYTTLSVTDTKEGFTALELYRIHRTAKGEKKRVARVVYWDACGQFFFETFDVDLSLAIVESLIIEAKETIKVR